MEVYLPVSHDGALKLHFTLTFRRVFLTCLDVVDLEATALKK